MKIKNGSIRHQTLYVMRYINFLLLFIYVCFKQWKPGINLPDIFLSDIQVPFEKRCYVTKTLLPSMCAVDITHAIYFLNEGDKLFKVQNKKNRTVKTI